MEEETLEDPELLDWLKEREKEDIKEGIEERNKNCKSAGKRPLAPDEAEIETTTDPTSIAASMSGPGTESTENESVMESMVRLTLADRGSNRPIAVDNRRPRVSILDQWPGLRDSVYE